MANAIGVDDWLDVLDAEYLSDFVADGGAAVKLAVATEPERHRLAHSLAERCARSGYLFVAVDARSCRAHMPQDIFHVLAYRASTGGCGHDATSSNWLPVWGSVWTSRPRATSPRRSPRPTA